MKLITPKRKSKLVRIYSKETGHVISVRTRIKLMLFGVIPIKTVHEYMESYKGEIVDCEEVL